MKALALLVAIASAGIGGGQGSIRTNIGRGIPSPRRGAAVDTVKFYAAGSSCGTTYTDAYGATIATSRSTVAQYQCPAGTWNSASANTNRVDATGLYTEPTLTYYVTNSCTAVAGETINLGGNTGAFIAQVGDTDTGTLDVAVGTAVASAGLPGSASAGSPLRFTISSSGTLTTTKTGTVAYASLVRSAYPVTRFCTAGSAANRAADVTTFTTPTQSTLQKIFTIRFTPNGRWQDATSRLFWQIGTAGANRIGLSYNGTSGALAIGLTDSASGSATYSKTFSYTGTTARTFTVNYDPANLPMRIYVDGIDYGTLSKSGTGTGVLSAFQSTTRIGSDGSFFAGGGLQHFAIADTTDPYAAMAKDPNLSACRNYKVAALGDSITAGSSIATPYPLALNVTAGCGIHVTNSGVDGNIITQMYTRWTSSIKGQGFAKLVLLGGVNDIDAGHSAGTIETDLDSIITEALAEGIHVYLLTITPTAGWASWTGARTTVLNAVNTWIRAHANVTVVDTYAALGDADPTLLKAAYDSGDHRHPNVTGAAAIATAVNAAF